MDFALLEKLNSDVSLKYSWEIPGKQTQPLASFTTQHIPTLTSKPLAGERLMKQCWEMWHCAQESTEREVQMHTQQGGVSTLPPLDPHISNKLPNQLLLSSLQLRAGIFKPLWHRGQGRIPCYEIHSFTAWKDWEG